MAAVVRARRPNPAARAALQRRTLRVLVAAQLLAGFGGSGAAAGALLGLEITGDEALASLPLALLVVGSSATVVPVSALSRRAGRRAGLTLALALAAVGAGGVVAGGAMESFPLVCASSALFGAGNTAVMLARYAAADLSTAVQRGRAIGLVVFATTFGAVAGPNLLGPAGRLARSLGLPELTGLYLCSVVAFALAALLLFGLLRPDPLKAATALAASAPSDGRDEASVLRLRQLRSSPAAAAGLIVMVVANFVMVAVMVMAPVHMDAHGHGLQLVGIVISLHMAGMFGPAPLTGWLTDRVGPLAIAGAGTGALIVAATLAAAAGRDPVVFALGITLLGAGWNAGLVAGSTLLASALSPTERTRAEGAGEVAMGVTAAAATAIAGPVVGLVGYATLAVAAAFAAAALAPLLAAVARRGIPTEIALALERS